MIGLIIGIIIAGVGLGIAARLGLSYIVNNLLD